MDQPFLHPIQGEEFIADPYSGSSRREGAVPEATPGGPPSRFDLTPLLGGPADIAAMQHEVEVRSGPLNLETPIGVPAAAVPSAKAPEGAGDPRPLPSGDEIGDMIAMVLEYATEQITDREAFCRELGHAIAALLPDARTIGDRAREGPP